MYFYLSNCNITHSSLWLKQIEKLNNQSLINTNENLSNNERQLLSSCCQYILNEISTSEIYNVCLLNSPFPTMNLSETKMKICLPILKNLTLLTICFRSYCQRWLRNFTSIHQENLNPYYEIILQKRREKFYDQSIDITDYLPQKNNSTDKYKGFLCQINSTWSFRLIDLHSYPSFGQNLGLMNHSKAIIVLQSKVRKNFNEKSNLSFFD